MSLCAESATSCKHGQWLRKTSQVTNVSSNSCQFTSVSSPIWMRLLYSARNQDMISYSVSISYVVIVKCSERQSWQLASLAYYYTCSSEWHHLKYNHVIMNRGKFDALWRSLQLFSSASRATSSVPVTSFLTHCFLFGRLKVSVNLSCRNISFRNHTFLSSCEWRLF